MSGKIPSDGFIQGLLTNLASALGSTVLKVDITFEILAAKGVATLGEVYVPIPALVNRQYVNR
jgi:hypothetical protein